VNFDSSYLAFIGSNYNDFKILRNDLNLNEVINENYFNASRPSVFITHGWRDDFREQFGKVMQVRSQGVVLRCPGTPSPRDQNSIQIFKFF